jgi:hypothetical protein
VTGHRNVNGACQLDHTYMSMGYYMRYTEIYKFKCKWQRTQPLIILMKWRVSELRRYIIPFLLFFVCCPLHFTNLYSIHSFAIVSFEFVLHVCVCVRCIVLISLPIRPSFDGAFVINHHVNCCGTAFNSYHW